MGPENEQLCPSLGKLSQRAAMCGNAAASCERENSRIDRLIQKQAVLINGNRNDDCSLTSGAEWPTVASFRCRRKRKVLVAQRSSPRAEIKFLQREQGYRAKEKGKRGKLYLKRVFKEINLL